MRLLIDAVLGILACVSLIFPWLSQVNWEETIFYVFVALLLAALILLLHLKPNDNAEKLINVAEVRAMEPMGKVKEKQTTH